MKFNDECVDLITYSYERITLSTTNYAELFYHRLFQKYPFARALFPDEMTKQVSIFHQTLDALVANVGDLVPFQSNLVALAQRHVTYGVKKDDYATVGAVLIDSFEEVLGPEFTPAMRTCWEQVYGDTAGFMVREAYGD